MIDTAKQMAKKYHIHYSLILSGFRPSGAIATTVWDEYGNLASHKKVFSQFYY
jgi:hypothetical protein